MKEEKIKYKQTLIIISAGSIITLGVITGFITRLFFDGKDVSLNGILSLLKVMFALVSMGATIMFLFENISLYLNNKGE